MCTVNSQDGEDFLLDDGDDGDAYGDFSCTSGRTGWSVRNRDMSGYSYDLFFWCRRRVKPEES